MQKPLLRWTLGKCLPQGLDVLCESIKISTAVLGIDRFDWMICYNGWKISELDQVREAIGNLPITLYKQSWDMTPIKDNESWAKPTRENGEFEWNGNLCGGTLWKVSPPRMRMESHEIIMDNDIIIFEKIPQIEHFLKSTHTALILEEPIRFYGRYDHLFKEGSPNLNSGFMGLPPGYDFGQEIYRIWKENGELQNITQADEQGLLMYALSRLPSSRIKPIQMQQILARDFSFKEFTGQAAHFTQVNRKAPHRGWEIYKGLQNEKR